MFSIQRTREIRNSCAALFIEQGQTFLSSPFSFRSLPLFFPFSMHSVKQSSFLSQRCLLNRLYIKHDNSENQKNPMRERKKHKHTVFVIKTRHRVTMNFMQKLYPTYSYPLSSFFSDFWVVNKLQILNY